MIPCAATVAPALRRCAEWLMTLRSVTLVPRRLVRFSTAFSLFDVRKSLPHMEFDRRQLPTRRAGAQTLRDCRRSSTSTSHASCRRADFGRLLPPVRRELPRRRAGAQTLRDCCRPSTSTSQGVVPARILWVIVAARRRQVPERSSGAQVVCDCCRPDDVNPTRRASRFPERGVDSRLVENTSTAVRFEAGWRRST